MTRVCQRRFRLLCGMLVLLGGSLLWTPPAADAAAPPRLSNAERKVIYQAQQAMTEKDYAKAGELLTAFVKTQAKQVHYLIHFTLGNALVMAGDAKGAIGNYHAAAKRHGENAAVWQNMGRAYFQLQRYAEAADSLVRAHSLAEKPTGATLYQAGVAYILAKQPRRAQPLLEKLVAGSDAKPEWIDALLKVYLDLKENDKALALTRKVLATAGDKPRMWKLLSRIYINRGEFKRAAAAMEVQASLAPLNPADTRLLGDVYCMANVPLQGARQYEKLLTETPKARDVEKAAGAYLTAHRPDKAIELLRRGIEQVPTASLWWQLAAAYYEKEEFDASRKAFVKSAAADPKNGRAHMMAGYCALQLDQLAVAKKSFQRAVRYKKERAEAKKMIAQIKRLQAAESAKRAL